MKVSIITVNYNDKAGLESTICSVLNQNCSDFEYIIIDGGSTDGSLDVIKQYSGNINYWISERDRGIYHAMNKGIVQAHGDYCLFLNSGDSFCHESVLKNFVAKKYSDEIIVGKVIAKDKQAELFIPPSKEISMYYLYSGTVPHQGAFIKTELLRKTPYDEELKIVSDWKFFLESIVFNNCSIRYVDEKIAYFDTTGISTSNPKQMWAEKYKVLSEKLPPRVLVDYERMKASECLTQELTPLLRHHYGIDRIMYHIGKLLLKLIK